jgi:uncharacterized membrane protein YraQ (UPF0718 family)
MKKIVLMGNLVLVGLLPFSLASADTLTNICNTQSMKTIEGIINWATCLLSRSVIPLLFALVVAFIWGVIQFYLNPENEEKRKKGKSFIVGGLIALFVMVAMWGIVGIFTNTFNVGNTMPNTTPQFK